MIFVRIIKNWNLNQFILSVHEQKASKFKPNLNRNQKHTFHSNHNPEVMIYQIFLILFFSWLCLAGTNDSVLPQSSKTLPVWLVSLRPYPSIMGFIPKNRLYKKSDCTLRKYNNKDLNNIWSDFEKPWFRQNVLSDLDPTSLKKGLLSLKPFLSSLDSLIPLKQLDNENEKKTILALAKKINKVHQIGSKVKNITNVTTPFEEISTCIKPLQAIHTPPDQAMLKEVVNFSGEVVKNVKTFSQLMDGLIKKDLKSISETIRTTIEFLKTTQNDSLEMWDNARKLEKENNLGEKLQKIVKQFDDVLKKDLFLAKPKIGFNVIKTVSKVFGGTNVDSALNCIQKKSVNNLKEMFGFLDQSDSLMNQKIEFTNATDFISNLLKIRKSFQEVIKKVKNATVSKESQKLMDSNHFKEVGTHSKVIGGSVAALRAIESVLKAEKSIKSVIDMDTDAKHNIPKLANKLSNHKDLKLKSLAKDLLAISRLDMRFKNHLKAFEVKNSLETTKQMLVNFLKSYTDEKDAERRRTMENSSDVGEEQMNFWEWLNTDEAEELIWNISWYFTVGWVTFWILFAISETICNIMYKRDFFFLKSAKQAKEKKAWKKDEEKKKNKKNKKEKNEKKMENPEKVKQWTNGSNK
ncbi:hypothetical protein L5515_003598 [Caenorhabditis briggsae]|uniref:Domain of unknown function WSN domain-containing protein n=1 Tax=Caenorhabditis briggsae TaxID=6238 RepID=A0AAE9EHS8_CAEBR|nr:hypothetical protein L5515_003598 [Caenorhabditis briggsae]